MATDRDEFRNISAINRLLNNEHFLKHPDATVESLTAQFDVILGMTISDLHGENVPFPINPYMVGITYVHRFIRDDGPSGNSSARGVRFPDKKIGIVEMVSEWKSQAITDQPLTGIVFITDLEARETRWFNKLIDKKAYPIGYESDVEISQPTTGASYFVANRMAVFAINKGIPWKIKENAQIHRLFTLSNMSYIKLHENVTITTRCFSDLKSVAHALDYPMGALFGEVKRKKINTSVVIALGWRSYRIDKILFHIGKKLLSLGHQVDYFFQTTEKFLPYVTEKLESKSAWDKVFLDYVVDWNNQKFNPKEDIGSDSSSTSLSWKFVVSPNNAVFYPETDDMSMEPAIITIPIRKNLNLDEPPVTCDSQEEQECQGTSSEEKTQEEEPLSIEITRRVGPGLNLMEFVAGFVEELV